MNKEEEYKIIKDLLFYGTSILKNGKRISQEEFYKEQNEQITNTKEKGKML